MTTCISTKGETAMITRERKIFKRLVEIRNLKDSLKDEEEKLRNELFMLMNLNQTIYGDNDLAEKVNEKEVVLVPKERIFEVLGEDKYIELSNIGISSLRGNISDFKLKKCIKRIKNNQVLRIRRIR